VQAQDVLALVGTVQAPNGRLAFEYRSGTPTLSGVVGPYRLRQNPSLAAPCGDGTQRQGVEVCDAPDLGGATCPQGGALGCMSTCDALDYTGCN
jgi:hypothetical protein